MASTETAAPLLDVLEAIARRFHERQLEDTLADVAMLIHEDAEMTLLSTHLQPLRGRASILAALGNARYEAIYSARILRCERLDATTVLVHGHARYPLEPSGFAHGMISWLDEFREALLWRVRAFHREVDARAAYRADGNGRESGLTAI